MTDDEAREEKRREFMQDDLQERMEEAERRSVHKRICPACNGLGVVYAEPEGDEPPMEFSCFECDGSGWIETSKSQPYE